MTTRRNFLLGSAALFGAGVFGGASSALAKGPKAGNRKFIFVFNPGGWDTTRVFANEFSNPNVDMELDATASKIGNIRFVDHETRPWVRAFFEKNHARTAVVNGVMVRSIAHEICTMIALTGSSSGIKPDWPAVLGAAQRDQYTLPHLVLDGPSFPGDLGVAVARTGVSGQLEALISGRALDWSDVPVAAATGPAEDILDRYMLRRAAARADAARSAAGKRLYGDYLGSMQKIQDLKDLSYAMDFTGGVSVAEQAAVAVEALSLGVSRCVTIAYNGGDQGWDTHANNDPAQTVMWDELFSGLGQLMDLLDQTPGTTMPRLADETTVVVLSEMGRTPQLNAVLGKDHWPYTSVMMVGGGVAGDRVIGGFDDNFYGLPVDARTGDTTEKGAVISAESIGATLLAMADVDPGDYVSGVDPIEGLIA